MSAGQRAQRLREGLATLQAGGGGSSQTPTRALLLAEPPNVDAGEITDKGYLNQRAVLNKRAALVERLHRRPAPDDVIEIEGR